VACVGGMHNLLTANSHRIVFVRVWGVCLSFSASVSASFWEPFLATNALLISRASTWMLGSCYRYTHPKTGANLKGSQHKLEAAHAILPLKIITKGILAKFESQEPMNNKHFWQATSGCNRLSCLSCMLHSLWCQPRHFH